MKTATVQLSPAHRCFGEPNLCRGSAGLQLQLLSKPLPLRAPTQQRRQKSLSLIHWHCTTCSSEAVHPPASLAKHASSHQPTQNILTKEGLGPCWPSSCDKFKRLRVQTQIPRVTSVSSERQVMAGNGSAQTDQLKTGPACLHFATGLR